MNKKIDAKETDTKKTDVQQIANKAKNKASSLTIGVTGTAILFLLLRIMAVAEWDWYIAGMIVDSINFGDVMGVFLGTLFSRPVLMSIGVLILTPLSIINLIWRIKDGKTPSFGLILLILFLGVLIISITSTLHNWWLPIGIAVVSFVLLILRLFWQHGAGQRLFLKLFKATKAVAVVWILLFAVLIDTPWMEEEKIETTNGTVNGYVLQVTAGFMKVLSNKPRKVTYIPLKEVKSRTIVE